MYVKINDAPHQNCILPNIVRRQYGKDNHLNPNQES